MSEVYRLTNQSSFYLTLFPAQEITNECKAWAGISLCQHTIIKLITPKYNKNRIVLYFVKICSGGNDKITNRRCSVLQR